MLSPVLFRICMDVGYTRGECNVSAHSRSPTANPPHKTTYVSTVLDAFFKPFNRETAALAFRLASTTITLEDIRNCSATDVTFFRDPVIDLSEQLIEVFVVIFTCIRTLIICKLYYRMFSCCKLQK